jgi:hypothetical protein
LPADQAIFVSGQWYCVLSPWRACSVRGTRADCSLLHGLVHFPVILLQIFVNNTLPPAAALMSQVYQEHKDADGQCGILQRRCNCRTFSSAAGPTEKFLSLC